MTKYISFAFTNLPGPKKPIVYKGKKTKKAWVFFIPVGKCGVSMAIYSHNGIIKLGITADDAMMKDPKVFIELFEDTMDEVLSKI